MDLPCKCKYQQGQKPSIIEQQIIKENIVKWYLISIKAEQTFPVLLKVLFRIYMLEKNL